MNYFYITGTSSGIGEALAEELLKDKKNKVIGISRSQTIEHENYLHIPLDLAKTSNIRKFRFEKIENASKIVLINNAGLIGDIKYMGDINEGRAITAMTLNYMAPLLLMNKFIKLYKKADAEKLILNVTSGAAQNPVDGWSVYCSSKAALDMMMKVFLVEKEKKQLKGFKIFNISPGVVDTQMQEQLRQSNASHFSRVDEFKGYKENKQLHDPQQTATKFIELIKSPGKYDEGVVRFEY